MLFCTKVELKEFLNKIHNQKLQFNETEERVDGLLEKIPKFMDKCQAFCNKSKDINAHRRLNSLTLTRNAELLEILELPQLMDSCLKSNKYNEALELSQYARQLGTKHSDIPIIAVSCHISLIFWIWQNRLLNISSLFSLLYKKSKTVGREWLVKLLVHWGVISRCQGAYNWLGYWDQWMHSQSRNSA